MRNSWTMKSFNLKKATVIWFLLLCGIAPTAAQPSKPPPSSPPPTISPMPPTCSLETSENATFTGSLCMNEFCEQGHQISVAITGSPWIFACTPCETGTYTPDPGQTCRPCDLGMFTNETASRSCRPCGLGFYSDQAGASSCRLCPAGSIVDKRSGAMACEQCPPGSFADVIGATECGICLPGTYAVLGATSCTNCSAGEFQDRTGKGSCQGCPPGTFSEVGSANCTTCPVGTYATVPGSSECTSCPAGTANDEPGHDDCEDCRPGWYSPNPGRTNCLQCPPGTYNPFDGAKECISCPVDYYTSKSGSTECEQAPDTFTTLGNASTHVVCDVGYYEENSNGTRSCLKCVSGMICTEKNIQLRTLELKSGYWRVNADSSKIYECLWDGCMGGSFATSAANADILCDDGYEGPECQVCSSGYYENLYAGSCSFCEHASISTGMLAFLIVAGIACLFGFAYAANRGMKHRVKMGMALRLVGNGIFQPDGGQDSSQVRNRSCGYLSNILCPSETKQLFASLVASMRTKIKILFVTFQIVSGFENNINVDIPVNYLGLLNVISFLNFELKSVLPIHCWIPSNRCVVNYFGEILIVTIVPLVLCLVLWILYYGYKVYQSLRTTDGKKLVATINHAYVFTFRVFIALTYVVFPPVSSKLFAAFYYVYYNDSSAGISDECYVSSALCVSCTDSYYVSVIIPYVLFMIVVYPIGIPLMYFALLYRQRVEIVNRPIHIRHDGKAMNKYLSERTRPIIIRKSKIGRGSTALPPAASEGTAGSSPDSYGVPIANINSESNNNGVEMTEMEARERENDDTVDDRRQNDDMDDVSDESSCSSGEDDRPAAISPETRALSLLYGLYLPSCAFFELFECVRRLALSGLMVFYLPGSPFQCVIGIMICVFALRVYAAYQPFLEKPNGIIAEMCQWQLFFTLFGFLLIKSETVAANATVGVSLLILNIGLPMAGISIALSDAAYEVHGNRKQQLKDSTVEGDNDTPMNFSDTEDRQAVESLEPPAVNRVDEPGNDNDGNIAAPVEREDTRYSGSKSSLRAMEAEEKQDSRLDLLDEPFSAPKPFSARSTTASSSEIGTKSKNPSTIVPM